MESFGLWGTFMALMMIGKAIANGGFHVCLMLPENQEKAKTLLSLCYKFNYLTIFVSIVAILGLTYFAPTIIPEEQYLLFVIGLPLSIFIEGKSQSAHSWLNRDQNYTAMSKGVIGQTIITVSFQLLFGFIGLEWNGLIVATLIGQLGIMILYLRYAKLSFFISDTKERTIEAFKEYKSFLTLGVSGNLINNAASNLPYVFFLGSFGEALNGHFAMVQQRVLAAPINLVSSAVSPVFFKEANKAHLSPDNELPQLVYRFNAIMWLIIAPAVILVVLWGPQIFTFILGEQWLIAGEYARWLAPLMAVRFVNNPMSYLIDIKKKLSVQLYYNIFLLICTVVIFYTPILGLDDFTTIKVFGVSFFIIQSCFLAYLYSLRND